MARSSSRCRAAAGWPLRLLSYGLATVLVLIGAKMLLSGIYEVPVALSLVATVLVLAATMILSVFLKPKGGAGPFSGGDRSEARPDEPP